MSALPSRTRGTGIDSWGHFDFDAELQAFLDSNKRHDVKGALIGPSMAKYIVENYNYRGQRAVKRVNYRSVEDAMSRNSFPEFTNIHFCVLGDVAHLIDGQHRMLAMANSTGTGCEFVVHFELVESERALEDRYGEFDKGAGRTNGDVMGWLTEELGIKKSSIRSVGAAAATLVRNFKVGGSTTSTRIHAMSKDKAVTNNIIRSLLPEMKIFYNLAPDAVTANLKNTFFNNGALIAASLVLLRADRVKATAFLEGVFLDDGLQAGDPRKAMVNWLIKKNSKSRSALDDVKAIAFCYMQFVEQKDATLFNPTSKRSERCLEKFRDLADEVVDVEQLSGR